MLKKLKSLIHRQTRLRLLVSYIEPFCEPHNFDLFEREDLEWIRDQIQNVIDRDIT